MKIYNLLFETVQSTEQLIITERAINRKMEDEDYVPVIVNGTENNTEQTPLNYDLVLEGIGSNLERASITFFVFYFF